MSDSKEFEVHYKANELVLVGVGGAAFLLIMAMIRAMMTGNYSLAILLALAALVALWFFYNIFSMARKKQVIFRMDDEAVYSAVLPAELGHKLMLRDIREVKVAVSEGVRLLCFTVGDYEGLAQAVGFTQTTQKLQNKYRDKGLGDFVIASSGYDVPPETVADEIRRRLALH